MDVIVNYLYILALALGVSFYLFGATWILYLAVMNLSDANDRKPLPAPMKMAGGVLLSIGVVHDFLLNMAVCLFLFFELPRNWLLTGTLQKHLADGGGYKFRVSRWLCQNLLDPFQSGGHCGR